MSHLALTLLKNATACPQYAIAMVFVV